jgi:hypothetical protein
MTMDLAINLAAPNNYTQSQFADIVLCGSRVAAPKVGAKGGIGPNGWPVGADNYQQNVFLGDTPTDYVFIVLKGAVSGIDINQGANNGGHIRITPHADTGLGVASATFTAKGAGYFVATVTDPGETRWAIVQAADLERWKADPYCFSSSWSARFAGFRGVRFMDWLMTNSNLGQGYVDPDPTRPGAFVAGLPLSIAAKFAKQTGIQPWFNIPVASTDAEIRSYAQRIDACRAAGLMPTIEVGNEVWNGAFAAHKYAVDHERALWGDAEQAQYQAALAAWKAAGSVGGAPKKPADSDGNRWYGYRATQASKILQSLGWKVGHDFHMAIGCFPNGWDRAPLVWAGVAAAGGADADFSRWIITFYTHGAVGGDFAKTVALVKAQDVDGAFNEVLHGKVSSVDWLASTNLPQHVAIAKAHGLELVAYEGNMSFYAIPFFADSALIAANAGITKADVVAFYGKLSTHPRSAEVMTAVLTAMEAAGVTIAYAYADQGLGGENGFWGLHGTPAWDAMTAWIDAHPSPVAVKADPIAAILAQLDDVRAKVARLAV